MRVTDIAFITWFENRPTCLRAYIFSRSWGFLSKYIKYRPDQKQYYKGHYSFYHGMNSEIRKRLPIREVCECALAIQEFLSQKESSSIQEGDDGTYQQFLNEISLFCI